VVIIRHAAPWVAAVALVFAACTGPAGGTAAGRPPDVGQDAVEVVAAWWDARNTFDYERMASLMAGDAFDNPFASPGEVEAARWLERVVTPLECEVGAETASLGTFVACDVSVTDIIVAAAGVTSTNLNRATFRVRDGYVIAAPVWIPSSQVAEEAIEEWARANARIDYQRACPQGIAGQSSIDGPKCARFIAENEHRWRDEVASLGLGD
jgi:hypothetical protein